MFKIAISGMKGRKKDSFLLCFVILLSVIFVVTSTSIYSSSEKTKEQELFGKYGTWENAYISSTFTDEEKILLREDKSLNVIDTFSTSTFGKVGSLPKGYHTKPDFKLIEGQLPNAMDEIAIEFNQVANIKSGVQIGDIIPTRITTTLSINDEYDAQMASIDYYIHHHIHEIYDLAKEYPEHKVSQFIEDYENYFFENNLSNFVDPNDDISLSRFLSIYNIEYKNKLLEDNIHKDLVLNFAKTQVFNTYQLLSDENMRIESQNKISYCLFSPTGFRQNDSGIQINTALTEEEVFERGIPIINEVTVIVPMKVTGFIENYTESWEGGENYPNAYITQEAFEKFKSTFNKNGFFELSDLKYQTIIFDSPNTQSSNLDLIQTHSQFRNSIIYPETPSKSDLTITIATIAMISIATIAGIFQINLTQMKRRTRKLILLKSIGAVKSQIYKLLISEFFFIFLICIPLGVFLGFGIAYTSIYMMNLLLGLSLSFYIIPEWLFSGIMLSIASVLLGSSFPILRAVNVPLTGTLSEPIRKNSVSKKKSLGKVPTKISKLTFKHISFKHLKSERKKNILTYALYFVTIGALLCTIALSYVAFTPYIDEVIIKNVPDFNAELIHGLGNKDLNALKTDLSDIEGVSDVIIYKYGINAFMYHKDLFNHSPFTELVTRRPYRSFSNVDETNDYLIEKSRLVNCYSIDPSESTYEKLRSYGIEKTLNKDAFDNGEEVILLLPSYNDTDLSFNFKEESTFKKDYAIGVGDTFNLTIPTEERVNAQPTNEVAFHNLKVGAIIHAFDNEGIWPFSQNPETPTILTSHNGLGKFFKGSYTSPYVDYATLQYILEYLEPTRMGRTSILVHTSKNANMGHVETEISKLLKPYSVKPIRNYVNKEIHYNHSLKISMIILVLGFSIAMIALLILYNTSLSKIESERQRIGILQALGVTKKQFNVLYFFIGFLFGGLSLVFGAFLAFLVLMISTGGFSKLFASNFSIWWLFPWNVCLIIAGLFVLIGTLIYYIPMNKALKSEPIHNINGLQH